MICENEELLKECQNNIYPPLAGLRKMDGKLEFALDSAVGLVWFPIHCAVTRLEKHVIKADKQGAFHP